MTQTEIKTAFTQVKSNEEAKKLFKNLSKVCHPDKGGTVELQQYLKSVYDDYLSNKAFFSDESDQKGGTSSQVKKDLEKIIINFLHIENININIVGAWIWINGDTVAIKEDLKQAGFRWARAKKMWYYSHPDHKVQSRRGGKSFEEITAKYGCQKVEMNYQKRVSA